ncbi:MULTISPECIES: hypothetical protein [unclassified Paenibacillus]|uniref:hypothetical protein n=1 Tax=unclassified Paenibacillus TaxID=185978 RepID=UPI000FE18799|nr:MULTISPECIES: hypothetical protein [unclassified Paenibacillus]MCM3171173.1 hypothetical protein [Paenibacillus sp. MER 99-2]
MKPSNKNSSSQRYRTSQPQSASRLSRPTAHIKNKSTNSANQSNSNSNSITSKTLDQLAVIAAILSLIAAALGLYIAWKSLGLPDQTAVVV